MVKKKKKSEWDGFYRNYDSKMFTLSGMIISEHIYNIDIKSSFDTILDGQHLFNLRETYTTSSGHICSLLVHCRLTD